MRAGALVAVFAQAFRERQDQLEPHPDLLVRLFRQSPLDLIAQFSEQLQ